MKHVRLAKQRLRRDLASFGPDALDALVAAFAGDVLSAVLDSAAVARCVAVTSDPGLAALARERGAEVVPDVPEAGINEALSYAGASLGQGTARVAIAMDLPCVRPDDVAALVGLARGGSAGAFAGAFVGDQTGTGTCAVVVGPGAAMLTAFGTRSRAKHRSLGYDEVGGGRWFRLRRDVDTAVDLADALRIGVGPATAAWCRTHGSAWNSWPTAAG